MATDLSIAQCRICHEEGIDSSKTMETPCACSGTLQFAHRECIQRWCDEKGNTVCEICLQKFEPGYAAAPPPKKSRLADVAVTIRESLEVPRQNHELAIVSEEGEILDSDYAECSSASERSRSCCRSMAVIFTVLLLMKHLISVLTGVTEHYAFTLFTLIVLRAGGILLPLYVMMRIIEMIRHLQQQQQDESNDSLHEESEEDEHLQHTVEIV